MNGILFNLTRRVAAGTASVAAGQADLSASTYLMPVYAFLFVGIVVFALLRKFKLLGDYPFIDVFVSLLIAAVFVTVSNAREMVLHVIPWIAVLIMAMFFLLILLNFMGKSGLGGNGLAWIFVAIMALIFIFAGIKIFSATIFPYFPGPHFGAAGDPDLVFFLSWLYSPRIAGAFWLILSAGIVSWVLLKFGGK